MTTARSIRNATAPQRGMNENLNYQQMVGDGVWLLKDGALMAGFWYEGVDFEGCSGAELEELRGGVNEAFECLRGGNFMLHSEAMPHRVHEYIGGQFSEATSRLIDEETAQNATHFRTFTALFVTWMPSWIEQSRAGQRALALLSQTEDGDVQDARALLERQLKEFSQTLTELEESLARVIRIRRMRTTASRCELLESVNWIVNGTLTRCRPTPRGMYLDTYLAHDFLSRDGELVADGQHVAVVSVMGYPVRTRTDEGGSYPGMLHPLGSLPFEYRVHHRFIVLDYQSSRDHFGRLGKAWRRLQRSFWAQLLKSGRSPVNTHAVKREGEILNAMSELESRRELYGHHSCVVVLRGADREEVLRRSKLVVDRFKEVGFMARIERLNGNDAYFSTLPGHGYEHVRKPVITTENLADLMHLHRDWGGEEHCPNPMFPPKSPPLFQGFTRSGDAFRFTNFVEDVGHMLIIGPTGAGKSTLLAYVVSLWDRYPQSRVAVFDDGWAMEPLARAHEDAVHYTLGADGAPALVPLADIDTPADRARAVELLKVMCDLQNLVLRPEQSLELVAAVEDLAATTTSVRDRSMTALFAHVQDADLRNALRFYTAGPGARVLNGNNDELRHRRFTVFEMRVLRNLGPAVVIPTLLYLVYAIEKRLDGRPTLIVMDEAGVTALGQPRMAAKVGEWAEGLRKANCSLVLAAQSLGKFVESPIRTALLDNCLTRVLLANPRAKGDAVRRLYTEHLQLTDEQVDLVASAKRKREYFYSAANGQSRLFSLRLGPVARAFVGASGKAELKRVRELYAAHGRGWEAAWLEERGLPEAAARWRVLAAEQARVAPPREREREAS